MLGESHPHSSLLVVFVKQTCTRIVVIGNGMVGHRLVEYLAPSLGEMTVTVFGEEPRPAYDRVGLTSFFDGKSADDLSLVKPGFYNQENLRLITGDKVVTIDREKKEVVSMAGERVAYDKLVLATGSKALVPPVPGREASGVFVYRTIEDLEAIQERAKTSKVGVVLGGGLLGLEAANALKKMGLEAHVLQLAPRLMNVQVDESGGALLKRLIEDLGVKVHVNANTDKIVSTEADGVTALDLVGGKSIPADLVVFSCGIVPRDELARAAGLVVGPRGGIVVDDALRTSDPDIHAIGECALWNGRIYGLVAPGYTMAQICADYLTEEKDSAFEGADMSTKLKLMGVDVASFGDAHGATPGARSIVYHDDPKGVYKKIVLSSCGKKLLGGVLVGDAGDYGVLQQAVLSGMDLPDNPASLILPAGSGEGGGLGVDALPASASICSCNNVTKGGLCAAIRDQNLGTLEEVKKATSACTGCGGCTVLTTKILKSELKKRGVAVNNHVCEHFPYSRQELYSIVRVRQIKSFDALLDSVGRGLGCETCKPAVASILASAWNDYILEEAHVGLQDTNDRFLANLQKDGTYSVVPRICGGEITPEGLIVIGTIAKKYGLYTKITGGQRIDLFGARVEQLPPIWKELIDAGFESGHAYGKSLRTVKSCVGSTWCRYGVQDSVGFAIELENRYKGLRSPHKIKFAVSGCTRECAEAQSKDVGLIATEKGWNLYVCGNGGMKPRHGDLLASDLDKATVVKFIDRFLMFYVRSADRLQRTSTWRDELAGGLDYLKQVVVHDSLGLGTELEAEMAHVVSTYQCEWKTTIEDEEKMKRFRSFVNADAPDDGIVFVPERGQIRPANHYEKKTTTLTLGATR